MRKYIDNYLKTMIIRLSVKHDSLCEDSKASYILGYKESFSHAILELEISIVLFKLDVLKSLLK